jgi:hypothetical protein
VEWIGLGLAIVGLGLGLWPLAFGELPAILKPLTGDVAIALIVGGVLLCLIPLWKRVQARRSPVSLASLKRLVDATDALKSLHSADAFGKAITVLARERGALRSSGSLDSLKV